MPNVKPDVIVSWPRTCDYPSWREFIWRERERSAKVIVVFTELAGPTDYRDFLRENLPAECYDSDPGGRDWRDVAVNLALDHSTSERVWFTEQDFEVTEAFWPQFTPTAVVPEDGSRLAHPCCLLTERTLIERTSRYFGTPPVDHFWLFGNELGELTPLTPIEGGYRHWQAISEGQMLIGQGERPKFHPDQFHDWLRQSLSADVPLHPEWARRARAELERGAHDALPVRG